MAALYRPVVPGLLLALALVGAQVLLQLLNLPLVHVRGCGQRRRTRDSFGAGLAWFFENMTAIRMSTASPAMT